MSMLQKLWSVEVDTSEETYEFIVKSFDREGAIEAGIEQIDDLGILFDIVDARAEDISGGRG